MIAPDLWKRVEPVLERALDLPPAEREAFLRQACGADAGLRDAVERLLRASDLAGDTILERPVAELAGPLLDAPAGVVRDRYELVRPVGSGGMGTVFLAHDRTLDRTVALKLLPRHVAADPEALRRFRAEARAASTLDHANIATVYDAAEAEDGRPFIVMRYYEGETLKQRLARGPLAVPEALTVATEVARGLAAAHAAGVVHRDVKPSNILLTPEGHVRVLDFGVAKTAGEPGPSPAAGTPAYMSPEQTRGAEVDQRTDLWSLGVVLYEVLTGRRPFGGEGDAAVLHAIRHDEPTPVRQAAPDVPEPLARIVERCLRKDPDGRFPDANALLRALGDARARRDEPIGWRRFRRTAVLLGAPALAVGLVLLGRATLGDRGAAAGSGAIAARAASAGVVRLAVLPFGVLGDRRLGYLEDGMVELFSTQLDGAGPLRTVEPRALLAYLRGDGTGDQQARAPVDGPAVARRFDAALFLAGSVVEAGGRLRIRAELYDADGRLQAEASSAAAEETRLFELVDEVARELIGSRYAAARERLTRLAAATTTSLPALKAYLEGERGLREGRFDQALTSFRESVARDSLFALAWYRLAVAGEWTVRPAIVQAAIERARTLSPSLPEHDRLLIAAWHAYATGAADEAERLYQRIVEGYPDDVEAWLQLGEVRFHYGPLAGRPLAAARAPFARVLAYEPAHEGALLHLARAAARDGDLTALVGYVDRLLAAQPESEIAIEARALKAFATGDEAEIQAVIEELAQLDSDAVFTAVWTVGYSRDPLAVAALAALLTESARPGDVRAAGHLLLAATELTRGRWRDARRELGEAARFNPAWALELGALWTASDILPESVDWGLDSVRAALEAWDAAAVQPSLAPGAFLTAHDGVHAVLRTYLLTLLDLARGARRPAARAMPRGHAEDAPWADTLAANLRRGLRAEARRLAGRPREALAILDSVGMLSPYALAVASPFHAGSRERLLRAGLLADLGRPEEALALYQSLGDGSLYDLPFMAWAQLRAGDLLESLGRSGQAAEHFRRAAALWRDAEPEFRAAAAERRRRAAGATSPSRDVTAARQ